MSTFLLSVRKGRRQLRRKRAPFFAFEPWRKVGYPIVCLLWFAVAQPGWADREGASRRHYLGNWLEAVDYGNPGSTPSRATSPSTGPVRLGPHFWIDRWLAHSEIARSQEQPIWPAAMVTQTPRLEEYMQYSQGWQQTPGGIQSTQYAAPLPE